MCRLTYGLIACWGMLLVGCGPWGTPVTKETDTPSTQESDRVESIIGKWEMIEDREHPRHDPPTETIEFRRGGGFVMRMNGNVEMEGNFRVEKDKVILTHRGGETRMGDPMTVKRLTADTLILTSAAGKDAEFVRK